MVLTDRLTVTYPRRGAALRDTTIALEPGSTAWVVGNNGSGKSTLGLALAGLIPEIVPATRRGTVVIGGRDPAALSTRGRATSVGVVRQDPEAQICTSSIPSELAFTLENRAAPAETIAQCVGRTMREWDLGHLSDRPLHTLSGGEKQLVAIAAVAVAPPPLFIVDEPAAYLDEEHRALVYRSLVELRSRRPEMIMLIVEHRTDGLPEPDVVFRCVDGRVVVADTPPRRWGTSFPRLSSQPLRDRIALSVEGLSFRWESVDRAPRMLFREFDLRVRHGEIVVVRGPNGCGKTTLLRLIAGALNGAAGRIIAEDIAYVPQNPEHLFVSYRVRDELIQGSRGDPGRAAFIARRFGLEELWDANPYELSSGQQRRVSIAIAAAGGASLVLLDEPTFALDEEGVVRLIETMEALRAEGSAQLVVTHDRRFAERVAHRLVTIRDGRPVEERP